MKLYGILSTENNFKPCEHCAFKSTPKMLFVYVCNVHYEILMLNDSRRDIKRNVRRTIFL